MKVKCPHCELVQDAPAEYVGRRAKCRQCRKAFILDPVPPGAVTPPASHPTDASVAEEASTEAKPDRPPFLVRAWQNSPIAFRTAFLATLGVVSALTVAWYTTRLPSWISGLGERSAAVETWEPREPTPARSPEEQMPIRTASPPLLPPPGEQTEAMAAIIELSTIMSQLEAFQQVRVASAESLNISQMRETSRSLSEAVEKLYWRTKNLNLPEDRGLVVVYEAVTEAVIAEHEFIRAVLKTVSDPGSLRATDALQREGDRMREISGRAFELLFIAYARLDPDLPRAIVDLRAGN